MAKKLSLQERERLVVMANIVIQKAHFSMSELEQKILCYLISKIQPEDIEFNELSFSIQRFCEVCGIELGGGSEYVHIKSTLQRLRDKSFWFPIEKNGLPYERTVAWFSYVEISEASGTVNVRFDDLMKPYLLYLRAGFTQSQLRNILAMRGKYVHRLYWLLKSFSGLDGVLDFDLEWLKDRISAKIYPLFYDFKRKALDPAIREINEYSDISVSYSLEKAGRKVSKIVFSVRLKMAFEYDQTRDNQNVRFNPRQIPGQTTMEGM